MRENKTIPFSFEIIQSEKMRLSEFDNHIERRLSNMRNQYLHQSAVASILAEGDPILYEVFEVKRPEVPGELLHGISIVHSGKIGDEYFMTKGHFHTVLETAEIYYCLRGLGFMVMETMEGEWAVEQLRPNKVLYVPPYWAHRSINTGSNEDLVTFFVYPGNSGHDYGSIEKHGFRKLVMDLAGTPEIVDNPRWLPLEMR